MQNAKNGTLAWNIVKSKTFVPTVQYGKGHVTEEESDLQHVSCGKTSQYCKMCYLTWNVIACHGYHGNQHYDKLGKMCLN